MIAFVEGGMSIPMGRVTRDFLNLYKLFPTQCAANRFRILGSVDEETEEESTIGLVCDEDFEIFYHKNMIEDVASTSRPATVVIIED